MPTSTEDITVTISEELALNISVEEEQPITVTLEGCVDIEQFLDEFLVHEEPTRLSATNFRTSLKYKTEHILVFVNGVKERKAQVVEISDNEFQIEAVSIGDSVEACYLRKS
jgi:hypothetical protein